MKFQGGTDKLTLAGQGNIILAPVGRKATEKYYKSQFGLGPTLQMDKLVKLAFDKSVLEPGGEPTGNEKYSPKAEDLIRIPFRLLTSTIIAGNSWRATFFPENVLKKSMSKLIGKPAYTDHMQYCDNFIGSIEGVSWAKASTDIPAGIDGVYLIDAAMNEKLARGLLMVPPAIHSSSVTVEFKWEPSHDFESEDDFYNNIGKMGPDKKMITRVATEIVDYHESSILWMGADPFAKMLDAEGKPMFVDSGSDFNDLTPAAKEIYTKEKKYFATYVFSKDKVYLTPNSDEQNSENPMNEQLLKLIREALGLTDDAELNAEQLAKVKIISADKFTEFSGLKTKVEELGKPEGNPALKEALGKVTTLTAERDGLKTDKDALTAEVAKLKPLAKDAEAILSWRRKEAVRLYKIASGDKAQDALIKTMEEGALEVVDGFIKQYSKEATEKYTAVCNTCGTGEHVEMRSSLSAGTKLDKEEEEEGESSYSDPVKFAREFKGMEG